ncbi:MAG: hypothetical protein AAF682_19620 [Planctomycetota bacterium]
MEPEESKPQPEDLVVEATDGLRTVLKPGTRFYLHPEQPLNGRFPEEAGLYTWTGSLFVREDGVTFDPPRLKP